jgi:nucleotide-binding universal stress UspA family protein
MKKHPLILVCSDFSEGSDLALRAAEKMRIKTEGKIHVLHVNEYPLQWDWVAPNVKEIFLNEELSKQLKLSLEQQLLEQIRRCEAHASGEVIEGIIFSGILSGIQKLKADFLFLGIQGKSKTPFHIGSVVVKMVSISPIPAIVVKKPWLISKMASLFEPNEGDKSLLQTSLDLNRLFASSIEVVSLWQQSFTRFFQSTNIEKTTTLTGIPYVDEKLILEKIKENILSTIGHDEKVLVKVEKTIEKKVAFHLLEILNNDHIDLVVTQRHQKGLLEKFLLGSETRRLLELFQGNLVILPPPSP